VEAWVGKEEVENPMQIFGPGRGFRIAPDTPKAFKIGRREDLEYEAYSK
jgi:hypothetical protein